MEWNVLSWLTWRYGCIMEDSESQLLCRPTGRTRFSWIQTLGLGFVLSKMFLTRLLTAKLERLEIIKCKKKAMGTDKPFKINKKPNEAAERRERSYQFLPTPVRSLFIPDPDLDFLPIPNPGVNKASDPGSATLQDWYLKMCPLPCLSRSVSNVSDHSGSRVFCLVVVRWIKTWKEENLYQSRCQ